MANIKPGPGEEDDTRDLLYAIVDSTDHWGRGHVVPQDLEDGLSFEVPDELVDAYHAARANEATAEVKPKRGRPSNAEKAARAAEGSEE